MNDVNFNLKANRKLFKNYPDILKVKDLKELFPKTGKNKIYQLLRDNKIKSKKIGRDYYIPKKSVIEFFSK